MRSFLRSFQHTRAFASALISSVVLTGLLHAVPTRQVIDIGGADSAYVQGFYDQQPIPAPFEQPGMARWSGPDAALRLPLIGIPARLTMTLRAPTPRELILITADTDTTTGKNLPLDTSWQTHSIDIVGVFVKLTDTPVLFRSETGPWQKGDLRPVGILLDTIVYETEWGARPYPSTTLAVVLTTFLLLLIVIGRSATPPSWVWVLATFSPHLLIALGWRWPLHSALVIADIQWWGLLAATLGAAWVYWTPLCAAWQRWSGWCTGVAVAGWVVWYMRLQQLHLTLVVPGVEKDFRSFATRSDSLGDVMRADGFYQLGYPAVLWAGRQLSGWSVFAVATSASVLAAALVVMSTWWIARQTLGRGWDTAAVAILLGSAFFGDAALLVGSDMPFAAFCTLSLAVLIWATTAPTRRLRWVLAGACIGAAYLTRHSGLVLVIPALVAVWRAPISRQAQIRLLALFGAGWLLVALPQLWVNLRDTGNPLFNHQAKNSWLAVYGGMDWGRWADVPDDISLLTVITNDPGRFVASWWHMIGQIVGSGATDQEYDRALWQRLLSIPFNWIGVVGVVWAGHAASSRRLGSARSILYAWAAGYIAVAAVAFVLPRFMLPLIVVAVVAAVDGARLVCARLPRWGLLGLVVLLGMGMLQTAQISGQRLVAGQPADEHDALAYVQTLDPHRLAVLVPAESPAGKYSVLSEVTVLRHTQYPVARATICAAAADYILWSNELVPPHPELEPLAHIGRYWVFRSAA
ncbi:MAG: hypothetical protein RLZZ297_1328, partial [Chloroflexota bacterium]